MPRKVGLWIIGAYGGVGSTTALGLAALAKGLSDRTGLVTALADFQHVDFDEPEHFIVGGHDLRAGMFYSSARDLHENANVFSERLLDECSDELIAWSENVKPGVLIEPRGSISGEWCREVADRREAIYAIRGDIEAFRNQYQLDAVVVVNAASTEPPAKHPITFDTLPTSSLYAWAAVEAGCPYVNLTPSLGGSFPAFEEHAVKHKVPHAGQDLKTGETLLKSVLAPMFAMRNLKVLSWVGHNILGNRDGQVLSDPAHKASKLRTKNDLLATMLGYSPQTHTSIEYIESLDDWKTAWDHVHFEGFLGTKMTLQLTWQGCDSILAAPLVIDLARLVLLAQRRGDAGTFGPAACFFKSPLGTAEHELAGQFRSLMDCLR